MVGDKITCWAPRRWKLPGQLSTHLVQSKQFEQISLV